MYIHTEKEERGVGVQYMTVDSWSSSWKEEQGGAREIGRGHLFERYCVVSNLG